MNYNFKYLGRDILELVKLFFVFVGIAIGYIFLFGTVILFLATPFIAIALGISLILFSICSFSTFC